MKRLLAAALLLALPLAAQEPGAAYRLDQVAVRLDGQAGGAASYSAIAAPSGCASGYVPYFDAALKLVCSPTVYAPATDTTTATGTIAARNLTAIGLDTPGSITVTPTLSKVGSITTVAGSALADGDYFTIKYGPGLTVPIEFDLSPGDGTSGGRVPYIFGAGDTADQIRDGLITLLNSAAGASLTASSGGAATVALVLDTPGAVGDTNTENVADVGFAVTGFANPTAATTYGYKVEACLADGSCAPSAEVTTALGHATLSNANYNSVTWGAVTGASYYKLYRTTGTPSGGDAPPRLLYTGPLLTFSDTNAASTSEAVATVNETGRLTSSALTAGRVPVVGTSGQITDDAGLTYDAATDTLRIGPATTAGVKLSGATAKGLVAISGDGSDYAGFVGQSVTLQSTGYFMWSATGDPILPGDTYLGRVSPGVVHISTGYGVGSGSLVADSLRAHGSLQAGNVTAVALATPAVTAPLTVNGTPGSTTYGYKAVAFLNDGTSSEASAEVTIATGPATLNGTDNITVAVPAVTGMAYMNIYRTTGGAAPPKLIYSGTAASYIDTGTEIGAETPATKNTTGYAVAARAKITGLPAYANNAAALAGGLVAGELYTITGSDPRAIAVAY